MPASTPPSVTAKTASSVGERSLARVARAHRPRLHWTDVDTPAPMLSPADRDTILRVARESISHGLVRGEPLPVVLDDFTEPLRVLRATFTTLHRFSRLRGCVGTLRATRPLITDVAFSAFSAAFKDPRFEPLTADEADRLDIHVSVLAPPEPIAFTSLDDLLQRVRPGIDGLILQEGGRGDAIDWDARGKLGTFLPSVWETVPDRREFVRHLLTKAGLPADYWSPTIRVWRYTAESIP